jgi:hypothetical protein
MLDNERRSIFLTWDFEEECCVYEISPPFSPELQELIRRGGGMYDFDADGILVSAVAVVEGSRISVNADNAYAAEKLAEALSMSIKILDRVPPRSLLSIEALPTAGKTDRLLCRVAALIPRRNREAIVGDLREDVQDFRLARWTEKQIRRHIWWQFGIIIVQRCKGVFRWGAVAWLGKKMLGWIVRT